MDESLMSKFLVDNTALPPGACACEHTTIPDRPEAFRGRSWSNMAKRQYDSSEASQTGSGESPEDVKVSPVATSLAVAACPLSRSEFCI